MSEKKRTAMANQIGNPCFSGAKHDNCDRKIVTVCYQLLVFPWPIILPQPKLTRRTLQFPEQIIHFGCLISSPRYLLTRTAHCISPLSRAERYPISRFYIELCSAVPPASFTSTRCGVVVAHQTAKQQNQILKFTINNFLPVHANILTSRSFFF